MIKLRQTLILSCFLLQTALLYALIDGDVRDLLSVKTSNGKTLIVIAKNNDHIQVIKSNK